MNKAHTSSTRKLKLYVCLSVFMYGIPHTEASNMAPLLDVLLFLQKGNDVKSYNSEMSGTKFGANVGYLLGYP